MKRAKPKQVSASELADFRRLHAEVALAHEKQAHAATTQKLEKARHELRMYSAMRAHEADMELHGAALRERGADLDAAKGQATAFAKHLSGAYAVDLTTHAIDPITGDFMALPGDAHGRS